MADGDLEPGARQHCSQVRRARATVTPTRPDHAEVVNAGASSDQIASQATLEAERELALDRTRSFAIIVSVFSMPP